MDGGMGTDGIYMDGGTSRPGTGSATLAASATPLQSQGGGSGVWSGRSAGDGVRKAIYIALQFPDDCLDHTPVLISAAGALARAQDLSVEGSKDTRARIRLL